MGQTFSILKCTVLNIAQKLTFYEQVKYWWRSSVSYILSKEVDQYHLAKYLINYCFNFYRDEQGCFRGELSLRILLCLMRRICVKCETRYISVRSSWIINAHTPIESGFWSDIAKSIHTCGFSFPWWIFATFTYQCHL